MDLFTEMLGSSASQSSGDFAQGTVPGGGQGAKTTANSGGFDLSSLLSKQATVGNLGLGGGMQKLGMSEGVSNAIGSLPLQSGGPQQAGGQPNQMNPLWAMMFQ